MSILADMVHVLALQVISNYKITRFIPFNPVDKRTQATVTMPSGEEVIACKGAPQVRMQQSCCLALSPLPFICMPC